MNDGENYCPQCGEPTEHFREGCCELCWGENQRRLDEHNIGYDYWQTLTDTQRGEIIRKAGKHE